VCGETTTNSSSGGIEDDDYDHEKKKMAVIAPLSAHFHTGDPLPREVLATLSKSKGRHAALDTLNQVTSCWRCFTGVSSGRITSVNSEVAYSLKYLPLNCLLRKHYNLKGVVI
jgi:hypothetical protein